MNFYSYDNDLLILNIEFNSKYRSLLIDDMKYRHAVEFQLFYSALS